MNYYDDAKAKIQKIAEDNDFIFIFRYESSPISFKFVPQDDQQITFDDESGEPTRRNKAAIEFIFYNGLFVNVSDEITIDDDLLCKMKNLCKKLHYLYLWRYYHWLGQPEEDRQAHVEKRAERELLTEYIH
jgi:hypothetical protein